MGAFDREENGDGETDTLQPPITEPVPIHDTFATGVEVAYHKEFVRLSYWAEHPLGFGDNSLKALERQIVAKVIMPTGAFEREVQRFLQGRAVLRQKFGH